MATYSRTAMVWQVLGDGQVSDDGQTRVLKTGSVGDETHHVQSSLLQLGEGQ